MGSRPCELGLIFPNNIEIRLRVLSLAIGLGLFLFLFSMCSSFASASLFLPLPLPPGGLTRFPSRGTEVKAHSLRKHPGPEFRAPPSWRRGLGLGTSLPRARDPTCWQGRREPVSRGEAARAPGAQAVRCHSAGSQRLNLSVSMFLKNVKDYSPFFHPRDHCKT